MFWRDKELPTRWWRRWKWTSGNDDLFVHELNHPVGHGWVRLHRTIGSSRRVGVEMAVLRNKLRRDYRSRLTMGKSRSMEVMMMMNVVIPSRVVGHGMSTRCMRSNIMKVMLDYRGTSNI